MRLSVGKVGQGQAILGAAKRRIQHISEEDSDTDHRSHDREYLVPNLRKRTDARLVPHCRARAD